MGENARRYIAARAPGGAKYQAPTKAKPMAGGGDGDGVSARSGYDGTTLQTTVKREPVQFDRGYGMLADYIRNYTPQYRQREEPAQSAGAQMQALSPPSYMGERAGRLRGPQESVPQAAAPTQYRLQIRSRTGGMASNPYFATVSDATPQEIAQGYAYR